MNLFQDNNKPQITFYFAECMEFPDYGEYKEFPTLAQSLPKHFKENNNNQEL